MRIGFKVGKLFGINIHIDWSWIFIFLLVTWNLAGAVFPSLHPDWDTATNIALGIAASLLFFLSTESLSGCCGAEIFFAGCRFVRS